jgi:hypothetical protein
MAAKDTEVTVDGRHLISLAKVPLAVPHADRYRIEEFPGGVLVLTPLVSVAAAELDEHTRASLKAAR